MPFIFFTFRVTGEQRTAKRRSRNFALAINCVDLVVHIVVLAIQAVLFISSLLEELNGNLTELCVGENVLLLLIILGDVCLKVVDLIMDQIGRPTGDNFFITYDLLLEFRVNGARRLAYLPATMSLNSLVPSCSARR